MSSRRACRASASPMSAIARRSRPSEKFGTLSSRGTLGSLRRDVRRAVLADARRNDAETHAEVERLAADAEAEPRLERCEERDDPGEDERGHLLARGVPEENSRPGEERADRLREALRRSRCVLVPNVDPRRHEPRDDECERAQLRSGEGACDEAV